MCSVCGCTGPTRAEPAVLEADPLAEGDFFPGDLLASVLRVSAPFWADHEALRSRVSDLADGVDTGAAGLTDDMAHFRGST